MNTATSFGGPFVLLPVELAEEWSLAMGENPEPGVGLYGEVCGEESWMHLIAFQGRQVLRIGDEPADFCWDPSGSGGLLIQWIGADSWEQLIEFGREFAGRGEWQEQVEWEVGGGEMRLMDAGGFEEDGQPKIEIELARGRYLVEAAYGQNGQTMATIFRISRMA